MDDVAAPISFASQDTSAGPILGRNEERLMLCQHVARLTRGSGGLVLVSGEAGIGKTTLVEAVAVNAQTRGVRVIAGHCYDLASTPPYGPWADILDAMADISDLPHPLSTVRPDAGNDELESQSVLFVRLRELFNEEAKVQPLLLILEDFHWADDASVELLRYLARDLSAVPIRIIVTYRVESLERDNAFYRLLPALVRECGAERMKLRPLAEDAIQQLTARRYGLQQDDEQRLLAYLTRNGEGNPFYVGELLRTLEDEDFLYRKEGRWRLNGLESIQVPPLVRQIVDNRVLKLSSETRQALEIAAVIGHEISVGLWAAVCREPESKLVAIADEAIEANLLHESATGVRFSHSLVRSALYQSMARSLRQMWHQRVAEVLTEVLPHDADTTAFHFSTARDPRAAEWLIRAAETAARVHAHPIAIERFTRALHAARVLPSPLRIRALSGRGRAHETIGNNESARVDYEAAFELARTGDDTETFWETAIALGSFWESQDFKRSKRYYEQALVLAREMNDPVIEARSLNKIGKSYLYADKPQVARQYLEDALRIARARDDRHGMSEALNQLGIVYVWCDDSFTAAEFLRNAISLCEETGNQRGVIEGLGWLAACGTPEAVPSISLMEARSYSERALRLTKETGWRWGEVQANGDLASIARCTGDFGLALDSGLTALRIAEGVSHDHAQAQACNSLGHTYLEMIDFERSLQYLERAVMISKQIASHICLTNTASALATALATQRDYERAGAVVLDAFGTNPHANSYANRIARLVLARICLSRGDPDKALAIVDEMLNSMPNISRVRVLPVFSDLRGKALIAVGRYDDAENELRTAQKLTKASGHLALLWRLQVALGYCLIRGGHYAVAEQEFWSAQSVVDTLADSIPMGCHRDTFHSRASGRVLLGLSELNATIGQDEVSHSMVESFLCVSAAILDNPLLEDLEAQRLRPAVGSQPENGLPSRLTSREVEVLTLVAAGRSNREIAETLFLSVRTVERHIANIYCKIDARGRADATAFAYRHNLVPGSSA